MNAADPGCALSSPEARAAFVAAMQRPEAYAHLARPREPLHGAPSVIRLIETHVSWVFLTGAHAYKVKKPLRLRFLDYSTAALRARHCREELRLNRRHAPGLYLDVVPIAGEPAAPRVGATDTPAFEHALRMVQFEPGQELHRLLVGHDVGEAEIEALAARIARVHARAAAAAHAEAFGAPAAIHRVTLDNLAELDACLPDPELRQARDSLRSAAQRRFSALESKMHARRDAGRVRECHGDLHCGNVVRWRGRLVAFDGLEFDPALRFIDVASDVAFLSMDLDVHGRADLRRAFLDRWAEASGDYDAIELLPYYEAHRALVRAKVAALRRQQSPAPVATGAAHYVEWAVRQGSRAPPRLFVMTGLSGSGKTWLGTRLARSAAALLLRSDVERKRLAGLGPLQSSRSAPGGGLYTQAFNDRTYTRLRECTAACLRGGESVVVDAANLRRAERSAFLEIGAGLGGEVHVVHCVAPLSTLRARIASRNALRNDASEATVELLERQPAYWEELTPEERARTVEVDTAQTEQVAALLARFAPTGQAPG